MEPASDRTCAPCTACCDFPALPVLQKPAYELCSHASSAGCGIYAERPPPCRDYACLWLDGELEDGDRPDQIGLAFDLPSQIEDHPDYEGIQAICARELWAGARDTGRAQDLLLRLARVMVVRLTARGGRTELMGPKRLVEILARRAAERQGPSRTSP